MRRAVLALALSFVPSLASAAFAPPPRPERYVTDRAGILDDSRRKALNERLAQFERETSNQVLVYVDRKLPADVTLEEFANRTFRAWKVGQKDKDNGVVFFAFVDDRKMRIEVGYGLEGAIPDARAKQITSGVVVPAFKKGDYAAGVEGAADALMKAARGEHQGTGKTVAEAPPPPTGPPPFWIWIFPLLGIGPAFLVARRGETTASRLVRAGATWCAATGFLLLPGGILAQDTRIVAVAFGLLLAAAAIVVSAKVGDWDARDGRRRVGLALVRAGLGIVLGTFALATFASAVPVLNPLAIVAILLGPPVLALGILLSFENPLRAVTRVTVPIACIVCLACGAFFLLMLIAGSSGAWVPFVIAAVSGVGWIGGWVLARVMGWRILPRIRFASGAGSSTLSAPSWSSSSSSSSDSSWSSSSSSSDSSFSGGGGDSGGGGSSDSW
ncbi:MAG: TPM domain-containing protein [Vicinamibacteria bacterium]